MGAFNLGIWDKIAEINSLQIFNFHVVSCSPILNVHACITSRPVLQGRCGLLIVHAH